MDRQDEKPSPDELEPHGQADPAGAGEGKLKEFLAGVGAFLTAVLAVGGGIHVLSSDAGSLHGVKVTSPAASQASLPGQPPSAIPAEAAHASAATIYRCEVYGKTVYANAPCSSRNMRPVDIFVNHGFEPIDTSALRARTPPADEAAALASSNAAARMDRCNLIEEAMRRNEEAARLPQPGDVQDDLTQQKRELLDEKHELGC
jgi:hypothetical protein